MGVGVSIEERVGRVEERVEVFGGRLGVLEVGLDKILGFLGG